MRIEELRLTMAELSCFCTHREEEDVWYTVMLGNNPLGGVELPVGVLTAGAMVALPAYLQMRLTICEATDALFQLGLFGSAMPALPPFPAEVLRLRRRMSRAARLRFMLVDATGAVADTSFVNLLEPPGDHRVVVVAGFPLASAAVGAPNPGSPTELLRRQ